MINAIISEHSWCTRLHRRDGCRYPGASCATGYKASACNHHYDGNVPERQITYHTPDLPRYNHVIMNAMAFKISSVSIVGSTVCSGSDQRNQQSSAALAFAEESNGDRWFPSQRASNAENVSIWWRHHATFFKNDIRERSGGRRPVGFFDMDMYSVAQLRCLSTAHTSRNVNRWYFFFCRPEQWIILRADMMPNLSSGAAQQRWHHGNF